MTTVATDDFLSGIDKVVSIHNTLKIENERLINENEAIRVELKRKRADYDELFIKYTNLVPTDESPTKVCTSCEKEYPVKSFTDISKKRNKAGEMVTYESQRRSCYKCRYAKNKQKKAKTA